MREIEGLGRIGGQFPFQGTGVFRIAPRLDQMGTLTIYCECLLQESQVFYL